MQQFAIAEKLTNPDVFDFLIGCQKDETISLDCEGASVIEETEPHQFMKARFVFIFLSLSIRWLVAQGNGFTYQGWLTDSGSPFTGNAEFHPTLWNAATGGTQIAANAPATVIVPVTNGLFVLPLDFGANFPGESRWLQVEVRTAIGPFTTLSPRQQIAATPYAMTASNLTGTLAASQLSGALPAANLSGTYTGAVTFNNTANTFSGNGAGLTTLNASRLTTGTVPDARLAANIPRTDEVWLLGGNAGTTPGRHFLGTTDNEPLELRVNGLRALRLEATDSNDTVNVVGGSARNFVEPGVVGATIGGGGSGNFAGFPATNSVRGHFGTISGGIYNEIGSNSFYNSVGGGNRNRISPHTSSATIAGGSNNRVGASSIYGAIGGGFANDIGTNSAQSAIGGGGGNNISDNSRNATIAGGLINDIGTNCYYSFIGGGISNSIAANSESATIAGGLLNDIGTNSDSSAIGGGNANDIAANSAYATIAGGFGNQLGTNSNGSVMGGGFDNSIEADTPYATIAGGFRNNIGTNSSRSTIGGGDLNTIAGNAQYATIPGGRGNAAASYGFAAGRNAKATNEGAFVWSDATATVGLGSTNNNSVTFRASGGYRFLTGASGGAQLPAGGTSWSVLSDRDAKKNIQAVDYESILEKLARVPVQRWHYQWETETEPPHLGPMAQDFKAAFYPGRDDKSISTLEFDGVALAAIQGLNQKLEEQRAQLKVKEAEIQQLKEAFAELKELVTKRTAPQD